MPKAFFFMRGVDNWVDVSVSECGYFEKSQLGTN